MAAPTITSVIPADQSTGIVLGTGIKVTFSTLIDHSTVTGQSFAVISPLGTLVITPTQEIQQNPAPVAGKAFLSGTFAFDDTLGYTVVTFTPSKPFQPNITYQVLIIGTSALLVAHPVKGADGTPLATNYSWSFTTGTLNLSVPPVVSPLLPNVADIDPKVDIIVRPRLFPGPTGADLTQEIDIVFPAAIDQTSFNSADLLTSIGAVLGDPSIVIPAGLVCTATIVGNTIKLVITGWPA